MNYRFYTADVFTEQVFGGNPLAVFPDARGISEEQMQHIAREFNLSETVFVLPPEATESTRRLRIFTPARELPFAGHPTVGTAHVLAEMGEISLQAEETRIVFEEGVGPIPVTIRSRGNRPIYAELTAAKMPEFGPEPPATGEIASVLSLGETDILSGDYLPKAVSCGVPFLFVPVQDLDTIRRVRIDVGRWEAVLRDYWAPPMYVFTFEFEETGSDLHARMFAPGLGVGEDPATGAATTALAGYLAQYQVTTDGTHHWVVEQGFEMDRPSFLNVSADIEGGAVKAIRVGGSSVMVSQGQMEISLADG